MKKRKRVPFSEYAGSSLIAGGLIRLADYLHAKLGESLIGNALSSYDETDAVYRRRAGALGNRFSGVSRAVRHFFMNSLSGSFIVSKVNGMFSAALSMPLRAVGIGALSAGIYTIVIWLLKTYTLSREGGMLDPMIGAALTLASLLLLMSKQTVSQAIAGSFFADLILYRLLGLENVLTPDESARHGTSEDRTRWMYALSFAFGTVFGIATFFVSPFYVLAAAAGLIAMRMVAAVPESGIVIMFTVLPFMPTMALVALTSWCFLCWALKLACGKRTIRSEPLDMWVLIFAAVYAAGGLVSAGGTASLKHSIVFCDFLLGYFMIVNLMRTGEWVKRCAVVAAAGGAAVSAYGIYEYIFGLTEKTWQDTEMFENISGRVVSTFGNPNVLAEYFLLVLPFAASLALTSRGWLKKLAWIGCFGIGGLCLILTWSRGAWIGFIMAALLYLLILNHKTLLLVFAGIFCVPFLPFVLPSSVISRFSSIGNLADTSTSYRVNIWKGVIKMARDFFFSGIGTGNEAFVTVYPSYSLAGIESAPHSHQLFLQLLIECGIFGLLAFIICMISFARSNFGFYRRYAGRSTEQRYISAAGFAGIFGILVQGMTDYVWYNYRVFLIFWLTVGLTSAARRAGIADNPIRAVKKLEDCSPDNAAIDIMIS